MRINDLVNRDEEAGDYCNLWNKIINVVVVSRSLSFRIIELEIIAR